MTCTEAKIKTCRGLTMQEIYRMHITPALGWVPICTATQRQPENPVETKPGQLDCPSAKRCSLGMTEASRGRAWEASTLATALSWAGYSVFCPTWDVRSCSTGLHSPLLLYLLNQVEFNKYKLLAQQDFKVSYVKTGFKKEKRKGIWSLSKASFI